MSGRFWMIAFLLAAVLFAGCQSPQPPSPDFAAAMADIPGVRLALDADCPDDFRPAGVGDVYQAHWDGADIWLCATDETLHTADNGADFMPWMQSARALHFHAKDNDIWFVSAQAGDKTISYQLQDNTIATRVVPGVNLLDFVLSHQLEPWLDASQLAQLWKDRGDKLRSEQHFQEAIQAYKNAVASNPDFADAYVGLGAAQLGLGDNEGALASLLQAASLAPENYWAQRLLGNVYLNLRRYELAVAPLTRAYELNPDEPQVLIGVALALGRSGHREQALQVLDRAASLLSDPRQMKYIRALQEEFSGHTD